VSSDSPLRTIDWLRERLSDETVRIVDTRWKLGSPGAGRAMYESGHVPGAIHLDMDRDLAGPPGDGGRHPLPEPAQFAATLSRAGIDGATSVIAYDDGDGMGAARLWWLVRHFGSDAAAVLDGGLTAWRAARLPIETGAGPSPAGRRFEAHPRADDYLEGEELRDQLQGGEVILLDARAPARWRGEVEPVDPVPGRIPGAINAPAGDNTRAGYFRSPEDLRGYYESLGIGAGTQVVASCGSGISACVDLLGLELAGLRGAMLYAGSYSGWLAKGFPVERG
jgi:thiosulfate/3-mercaptopyruvate sulfurtransferase